MHLNTVDTISEFPYETCKGQHSPATNEKKREDVLEHFGRIADFSVDLRTASCHKDHTVPQSTLAALLH